MRPVGFCLLAVLLFLVIPSTTIHTRAQTQNDGSVTLSLSFMPSAIDEKNSYLLTNFVQVTVFNSNVESNQSFAGQFCYPYWRDLSQLGCFPIWNRDRVSGHYRWNDSESIFYNQQAPWALYRTGEFPFDTFSWPILIGCNLTVQPYTTPLESKVDYPENLTSNWIISEPELIQWNGIPSNSTLSSMWPGLEIPKGTYPLTKYTHWYYIQITLTRNENYSQLLALFFWTPAIGVIVGVIVWTVPECIRRIPRESNTDVLAVVAGAFGLLGYTLEISSRYPQNGITLVQWILFTDFVFMIIAPSIVALTRHLRLQVNQNRPPPSGVYT